MRISNRLVEPCQPQRERALKPDGWRARHAPGSGQPTAAKGKYSGKYALSELLTCGEYGTRYRRVTWARSGKSGSPSKPASMGQKKIVWRCISRLEYGLKYCKSSPSIEEDRLHAAILHALNRLIKCKYDLMAEFEESLVLAVDPGDQGFDPMEAQRKIAHIDGILENYYKLCMESPSEMMRPRCRTIWF